MTTPTVVPTGYANDATDFLKVKRDPSGAVRIVDCSVTVPTATAVGAFVGLVPFNAGAKFIVSDKSFHITDIDAEDDSTVNVGIIYADTDEGADDVDAFVAASTAGQGGGFISLTNVAGLTYVTTGKGWLALENEANITEAEGTVTFNVGVAYDK
jgi:hypothetical protein